MELLPLDIAEKRTYRREMNLRNKVRITVGAVLAAAIVVPVIHHYQLRWALHSYIAELKARGVPMDLAQVIPPPLPPEKNGADAFRQADAAFNETLQTKGIFFNTNYVYGMTPVAPGKAMVRSQEPDFRDSSGTVSWQKIAAAVDANAGGYALLHQIIDKPAFDFQFNYAGGFDGFDMNKLSLANSKRAAQRLGTAVLCDLQRGDTASAVTNLRTMLVLSKAMAGERLLISELVSMAIVQMTVTANWELLQSTNVTDEQLTQLQKDWADMDLIHSEENALAMESVMSRMTAEQWRNSNAKFQEYLNMGSEVNGFKVQKSFFDEIRAETVSFEWRYWWSYPDELKMLKGHEILRETSRMIETNHSFQAAVTAQGKKMASLQVKAANDQSDMNSVDMHSILSQNILGLSAVHRKMEATEVARQVVMTAMALKRYQLKHGNYPPDLDSLVPEFVPAVPLDPVDGQPLRYRPNADGTFLLYSIGQNGVDNGGDPSIEKGVTGSNYYWQNSHALDWVWPQPATDDEILRYYKAQAKKGWN